MALGEGVSARVVYKAYASGAITSGAKAVSSSDLGVSGGQIYRRVASTLNFQKDTYQSAEIRSDQQIADFRHGVGRVTGNLSGEISPLTHFDLIEAAFRGTRVSAVAKSNTELTSVLADGPTTKFTFGGGNPVTEGYRVGMIVRFTNLSEALNNSTNYLILGFGGASNREMTVFPAPTTMGADSLFNVTSVGKSVSVPASGHVKRKFGIEAYHSDVDVARLFTECRVAGMNLALPATGMATIEFPFMGRDMETYEAGTAPFFTAPTAETTTGIFAAVNGLIRLGGATVGVITGAQINMNLSPEAPAVVGQGFTPEIFLGRANVTGQLVAFFENLTILNYFKNETEVEVLLYLTATSAVNSPAWSIYLPRVKIGGADLPLQGETSQSITLPFQALKYQAALATVAGVENTTIMINDTEVT